MSYIVTVYITYICVYLHILKHTLCMYIVCVACHQSSMVILVTMLGVQMDSIMLLHR